MGAPVTARAERAGELSYEDARGLEQLPRRIESLGQQQAGKSAQMSDPAFFQQGAEAIAKLNAELAAIQAELEQAYARWSELDQ